MEVIRHLTPSSDLPRGGVVTIGNFDGVHLGHQFLIRGAVARARELGVSAVALTFDPHPEKVLRPETGLKLVTTSTQRAQLLAGQGLDALVEIPFDRRFASTSAEDFASEFLHRRLRPLEVRLGNTFRFGTGRRGDVKLLADLGRSLGFDVVGVDPVMEGEDVVSSTRVRREVAHGRVDQVWRLLGRPMFVDGRVYSGERMGRKLGFPTLNIALDNELMPAHGVYVTAVHIPSFDRVFPSVTNIGVRPTVYENYEVTVESHVLDFVADVYKESVRAFFFRRLRDERIFRSSLDLVTQIRRDVTSAREFFVSPGMPTDELVLR